MASSLPPPCVVSTFILQFSVMLMIQPSLPATHRRYRNRRRNPLLSNPIELVRRSGHPIEHISVVADVLFVDFVIYCRTERESLIFDCMEKRLDRLTVNLFCVEEE
ncbi:unnamed protein product [Linum trigynum]|uniref:Secreted protein n=1 Tax=Linum trigynum TaxID=586398 RepID=A0AAV2DDZ4_9ROSI